MSRTHDLVSVGACNVDLFYRWQGSDVPGLQEGDERVTDGDVDQLLNRLSRLGQEPLMVCGGGQAANVAVAAAHFGLSVGLVCRIGTDSWGNVALNDLGAVDLTTVTRSGRTTRAVVFISSSGERTILLDRSDEGMLSQFRPRVGSRHFHFTSTVLPSDREMATEWIAAAHEQSSTSIDGGALFASLGAEALVGMYSKATIVFATAGELELLTRRSLRDSVKWMFDRGVEIVCVKEGRKGAKVLTCDGASFEQPAPSVIAVDTTAAGDAFAGAFLAVYLQGRSLSSALTQAVRFASASATNWGRTGFAHAFTAVEGHASS